MAHRRARVPHAASARVICRSAATASERVHMSSSLFALRTSRHAIVVLALGAGGTLSAACHFGCWDPDPDCHGNYDPDTCDCPSRYIPSYPTGSSPPSECVHDGDCAGRARCWGGRCEAAPGACVSNDDCPYGSRCESRHCRCDSDLACGDGVTCSYGECLVCLGGDASSYPVCRALTCDARGECPTPLTCDKTDLTCRLAERRPCSDETTCAPLMACIDGYCTRRLAEGDAGTAAPDGAEASADGRGEDANSD